jgi:hypothetical protein
MLKIAYERGAGEGAPDNGGPRTYHVLVAPMIEWVSSGFEAAGARWDMKDNRGRTLLHVAARDRDASAVRRFKFLMEKSVDPMLEGVERRTALDVATASENNAVLELFKQQKDLQKWRAAYGEPNVRSRASMRFKFDVNTT